MRKTTLILVLPFLAFGCDSGGGSPSPDLAVRHDLAASEGGLAASCDVVKQDCKDPTQKCSIVDISTDPTMQNLAAQCTAINGNVTEGQACTRPGMTFGIDNCSKGLVCSALNLPTGQHACRQLCLADSDCTVAGDKCVAFDSGGDGVCFHPCTPFGTDCPTGTACQILFFNDVDGTMTAPDTVPLCESYGTTNTACMDDSGCKQGSICLFPNNPNATTGTCSPLCDSTHQTCPKVDGGGTCQSAGVTAAPTFGYCG